MRRTFCARCHAIGLARCVHRTRTSGSGGKHRARETYRIHPAKTLVNTPTSPFTFFHATDDGPSGSTETIDDRPPSSSSSVAKAPRRADGFTTLMHELWNAPHAPIGELPEELARPEPSKVPWARSVVFTLLIVLIAAVGFWNVSRSSAEQASLVAAAELSLEGVTEQLPVLSDTINTVMSTDSTGVELSDSATTLARWAAEASELLSQGLTETEDDPLAEDRATFTQAGEDARELQQILADTLSTRLILGALDISPVLPLAALPEDIPDIAVDLALTIDDAESRLSLLPTSSAPTEIRVRALLEAIKEDHSRYLQGLDQADLDVVNEAIQSLRAKDDSLSEILTTYLNAQRPIADQLVERLDEAIAKLRA
jgi:hypothetical protein